MKIRVVEILSRLPGGLRRLFVRDFDDIDNEKANPTPVSRVAFLESRFVHWSVERHHGE